MTLEAAYDPDNVFARILRGELPAVKVWEDAETLVFMDVFPQSEGHMLVISRTSRARTLLDVEPDTLARLAAATQRAARAAVAALGCDGVSIMQFNGAAGGQTVFHLHFHVIPRWADRTMAGHGQAGMAEPAALAPVAAKLAAAF
jgi:histidine triad (HIT) family protein